VELMSPLNLLVLGVLALIIFGPDQLPKLASQAGRALRDLRRIAEAAKADLTEGLGPEFQDFDITDLHPKNFVRKHLWEEFDATGSPAAASPVPEPPRPLPETNGVSLLAPGESPPYDSEAT
jgi:sec-independent protein translocase protein TatB